MRVYISVDMEGVAGVVHEDQTDPIDPRHAGEYNRFRRLMTSEANAAVEGGLAAGATRILVNDSHWQMRNLLAEDLHPAAELLSGGPKLRSMVEGVELAINAALAGSHGVPVVLVSGDQALAAEAKALLGDGIEAVVVKHAVGRIAARSVSPAESCRRIRDGAAAALGRKHQPLLLERPVR